MSGFSGGAVLTTVIGSLIVVVVVYLFRRYWQHNPIWRRWRRWRAEAEARRLRLEFRRRSGGNLDALLSIDKAARQADVDNPDLALALLSERGLIDLQHHSPRPIYARLTPEGLRGAERAESRPDRGTPPDPSEGAQEPAQRRSW